MDLYRKVRMACADCMSQRETARYFNISRYSVRKMMTLSIPPGYRRTAPVKRPKLDGFIGIIDGWLDSDQTVHRKERYTAKRVFQNMSDRQEFVALTRSTRASVEGSGPEPMCAQTTRRIVLSLTLNRSAISGIGRRSMSRMRRTSTF